MLDGPMNAKPSLAHALGDQLHSNEWAAILESRVWVEVAHVWFHPVLMLLSRFEKSLRVLVMLSSLPVLFCTYLLPLVSDLRPVCDFHLRLVVCPAPPIGLTCVPLPSCINSPLCRLWPHCLPLSGISSLSLTL